MQKQKIISALVILIVVAFIVPQITLAAWWNPFSWHWGWLNSIFHFQQTQQKQEDSLSKQDLVGFWQNSPSVGAGFSNRYHFYLNGNFEWYISQMSCEKGTQAQAGTWDIKSGKLVLNIIKEAHITKASECGPSGGWLDAQYNVNTLNKPKLVELSLSAIAENQEKSPYPYSSINGVNFYRISKDPSLLSDEYPIFNQTAGWKTYTNTKYGFEFKLPNSFVGAAVNDESYLFSFRTEDQSYLTLLVTTSKRYGPYSNVTEIFVGGVKSYKGNSSPDCYKGCNSYMPIFVPLDTEKSLEFGFSKSGGTAEEATFLQEDKSLIDKILSTFKFTTPINQTAGWKTYTSSKYGFSFKYPKEWTLEVPNGDSMNLYKYIPNPKEKQYEGLIAIRVFNPNPAISAGGNGDRPDVVSSSEVKIDGKTFTKKVLTWGSKTNLTYSGVLNSNQGFLTDENNFGIQAGVYSYVEGTIGNDFDGLLDQIMKTFKFTK